MSIRTWAEFWNFSFGRTECGPSHPSRKTTPDLSDYKTGHQAKNNPWAFLWESCLMLGSLASNFHSGLFYSLARVWEHQTETAFYCDDNSCWASDLYLQWRRTWRRRSRTRRAQRAWRPTPWPTAWRPCPTSASTSSSRSSATPPTTRPRRRRQPRRPATWTTGSPSLIRQLLLPSFLPLSHCHCLLRWLGLCVSRWTFF